MDSSSGWASTSSTFLTLLSPRRGGGNRGLGGRLYGAGEERIRPRETAQRRTAPAAGTIQIHAMETPAGESSASGEWPVYAPGLSGSYLNFDYTLPVNCLFLQLSDGLLWSASTAVICTHRFLVTTSLFLRIVTPFHKTCQ
jgi:hypothetical protein